MSSLSAENKSSDEITIRSKAIYKSCTCKWIIERFTDLNEFGPRIDSPEFKNNQSSNSWFLRIYPHAETEINKEWVSLYLYLASVTSVHAKITLTILRVDGTILEQKSGYHLYQTKSALKDTFGFKKFMKNEEIFAASNNVLGDEDSLVIVCKLTEIHRPDVGSRVATNPSIQRFNGIKNFYSKEQFCDVTLIIGSKSIKVHKLVLVSSSSVFNKMFDVEMREKQLNEVSIEGIDFDVVEAMVNFLYGGDLVKELAQPLLVAADRYDLKILKDSCESHLATQINDENVVTCLDLAKKYNAAGLKKAALEYITSSKKSKDLIDAMADLLSVK